jgi:hypothetical protein
MSISVIGLGKIGSAIVPHLLSLGEEVKVWNRSRAAVDKLIGLGTVPAPDISDAFAADIVLSALFDDEAVRQVFTSDRLEHISDRGTLHVCLSTVSPDLTEDLARLHASSGGATWPRRSSAVPRQSNGARQTSVSRGGMPTSRGPGHISNASGACGGSAGTHGRPALQNFAGTS